MNEGWLPLWRKTLKNDIFRFDRNAWHLFEVLMLSCDQSTGVWKGGRFQLAGLADMNPNTTYSALKRLEKAKMITLSSNTKYTEISICNIGKYAVSGNTKKQQPDNNQTTTRQHSNKNKELRNNTTNVVLDTPKQITTDINEMFDAWQAATGMKISSRVKANRFACSNLLKKYGKDDLLKLIRMVAAAQADKYAPNIADFSALQSKTNELLVWAKKQGMSQAKKVVKI